MGANNPPGVPAGGRRSQENDRCPPPSGRSVPLGRARARCPSPARRQRISRGSESVAEAVACHAAPPRRRGCRLPPLGTPQTEDDAQKNFVLEFGNSQVQSPAIRACRLILLGERVGVSASGEIRLLFDMAMLTGRSPADDSSRTPTRRHASPAGKLVDFWSVRFLRV